MITFYGDDQVGALRVPNLRYVKTRNNPTGRQRLEITGSIYLDPDYGTQWFKDGASPVILVEGEPEIFLDITVDGRYYQPFDDYRITPSNRDDLQSIFMAIAPPFGGGSVSGIIRTRHCPLGLYDIRNADREMPGFDLIDMTVDADWSAPKARAYGRHGMHRCRGIIRDQHAWSSNGSSHIKGPSSAGDASRELDWLASTDIDVEMEFGAATTFTQCVRDGRVRVIARNHGFAINDDGTLCHLLNTNHVDEADYPNGVRHDTGGSIIKVDNRGNARWNELLRPESISLEITAQSESSNNFRRHNTSLSHFRLIRFDSDGTRFNTVCESAGDLDWELNHKPSNSPAGASDTLVLNSHFVNGSWARLGANDYLEQIAVDPGGNRPSFSLSGPAHFERAIIAADRPIQDNGHTWTANDSCIPQ